ncbi:MAG: hypothetical protein CL927_17455 [Deltaproteobacteria bacterium]|nr:hypothetical protein [Deltaproteobacteria bacterium]HCH64257.1 hypothetical protein [Deltaproteobacteria bacterium]
MPALLVSFLDSLSVFTQYEAVSAQFWDTAFTLGLAGALLTAGVAVIMLLPWTDQQIASADQEAKTLIRQVQARVAPHSRPAVVAISRGR